MIVFDILLPFARYGDVKVLLAVISAPIPDFLSKKSFEGDRFRAQSNLAAKALLLLE